MIQLAAAMVNRPIPAPEDDLQETKVAPGGAGSPREEHSPVRREERGEVQADIGLNSVLSLPREYILF